MSQEASDIEKNKIKDILSQLTMRFVFSSNNRKHDLLKKRSKNVILLVTFQQTTYLSEKLKNLFVKT